MAFADQSADFTLKIILLGDTSVGKSCLMERYLSGTFSQSAQTTVGVGYGAKNLEVAGQCAKLQIWDTVRYSQAGQEIYRSITRSFYRGANAACVVFNLTNRCSFESIEGWIKELTATNNPNLRVYLLANMSDIGDRREVETREAKMLAERLKLHGFWEVSAKSGDNVPIAFDTIAHETFSSVLSSQEPKDLRNSQISNNGSKILLATTAKKEKNKSCCK